MIVFASDHAGYDLASFLMSRISDSHINLGPHSNLSVDYPDYAHDVCRYLWHKPDHFGVLICGTGIGMSMAANRHPHIRCAVATNAVMAEMARRHNNANVLALGARLLDEQLAFDILSVFVATPYEGGRHAARVEKISDYA